MRVQTVSTGGVEVAVVSGDDRTVRVCVETGDETFDVWCRASVPLFTDRADAAVPLGVLAAMHAGVPLVVRGGVSPVLAANTVTAQHILAAFTDGELTPVPLVAEPASATSRLGTGVGAFFSGGVDSFGTALVHAPEITHLVFVRGWDILDLESPLAVNALESARRAADALGKQLIEVDTNVRAFTERFAPWTLAHGPAMGALALLLQSQLRRVLVASSYSYSDLRPWGSHPLLDHLWGTESLDVDHDGCGLTRIEKVGVLATSATALEHLRVCTDQRSPFNCGACDKCVRTMMLLRLAGVLDRSRTLPRHLAARRVARLDLGAEDTEAGYRRKLVTVGWARRDWPIVTALLVTMLRRHPILAVRHRLGDVRRARWRRSHRHGRPGPVRLRRRASR